MNETLFLPLFLALFGMAIIWLVLVSLLFKRLAQAHPQKYDAMGRPSLFPGNNPSGVFAMLRFLLMREHRVLNDVYLSTLSDVMLVFFFVYLVGFVALFSVVVSQPVEDPPFR